ncbi:hypothetical protein HBI56_148770 [Parastagonospora nodorum]|nr:hypothetical protein HBH53_052060 [Parastagonospora nodorum]KAH3995536.1 hypothetical protein HBI10_169600 [Parastagonospora nodorum]KAH4015829.1 hypothetical protein HBI13_159190 [Parastagonospora nodorum]KAH4045845.1 hypothetical protein HBH49_196310 [Parastagonospora nodorum]KAH4125127.1 hypothetical protein HBH47_062220 [Parastagonospora nodorum]
MTCTPRACEPYRTIKRAQCNALAHRTPAAAENELPCTPAEYEGVSTVRPRLIACIPLKRNFGTDRAIQPNALTKFTFFADVCFLPKGDPQGVVSGPVASCRFSLIAFVVAQGCRFRRRRGPRTSRNNNIGEVDPHSAQHTGKPWLTRHPTQAVCVALRLRKHCSSGPPRLAQHSVSFPPD